MCVCMYLFIRRRGIGAAKGDDRLVQLQHLQQEAPCGRSGNKGSKAGDI